LADSNQPLADFREHGGREADNLEGWLREGNVREKIPIWRIV
jgi:hypothetical protein